MPMLDIVKLLYAKKHELPRSIASSLIHSSSTAQYHKSQHPTSVSQKYRLCHLHSTSGMIPFSCAVVPLCCRLTVIMFCNFAGGKEPNPIGSQGKCILKLLREPQGENTGKVKVIAAMDKKLDKLAWAWTLRSFHNIAWNFFMISHS